MWSSMINHLNLMFLLYTLLAFMVLWVVIGILHVLCISSGLIIMHWSLTCLYHWWTQRGATIVYATHIFDGLETWATHLAYIQNGELNRSSKMADISEMKTSPNLLSVVESWLRSETKIDKKKKKEPVAAWKPSPFDNSPFRSSRHMAYYRWLVITDEIMDHMYEY